ncbi:MAG: hypothetical protein SPJ44_00690 [Treponema sp.]|nr:hypothetical protein [Treponema sp.]
MAFVGCANPAGGSYSAKYAVGDIILNDGSKVNYETAKNYTGSDLDELKSKAIAVIFRADTASKKALGVGLKHNRSGLAWCTSDANAYKLNFNNGDWNNNNYVCAVRDFTQKLFFEKYI